MKTIFLLITLISLTWACVDRGNNAKEGEESDTYESEEADNNDLIDNDKLDQAFTTSPYFAKWDTNGDKVIGPEEFYKDYFTMLDQNKDNVLDNQEWQKGIASYFGENGKIRYGKFPDWDSNGDKQVQPAEFQAKMKDAKYFKKWDEDGDGKLTEKEFSEEVFAKWDTDGNGVIESQEYEEWDKKVDNF